MLFTNNEINTQSSFSPQYPNYKNADWKIFKNFLNSKVQISPALNSIQSIDENIDELTQTITEAITQ